MGTVGTTKSIALALCQFGIYRREIARRQHHVGVEHDEILSLRPLRTIVAALARARVLLIIIVQV